MEVVHNKLLYYIPPEIRRKNHLLFESTHNHYSSIIMNFVIKGLLYNFNPYHAISLIKKIHLMHFVVTVSWTHVIYYYFNISTLYVRAVTVTVYGVVSHKASHTLRPLLIIYASAPEL
jgi:hypothetical protein